MEGDATYLDTLVEESIVNGLLHPLQLFGIAAIVRIYRGFVDREVQESASGNGAVLGFFCLGKHVR